jgi:lysozyme family protein
MTIDEIIEKTLTHEGGYVHNPNDRGGATNFGITEAVARANGYNGDMRSLTREQAVDIYKQEYFNKPRFNLVYNLSQAIAVELFDTGVNMGVKISSRFLQQALNILNNNGKLYSDIAEDGLIGNGTIAALTSNLSKVHHAERLLLKALNGLQFMRYYEIVKADKSQEAFIKGWVLNRVE